MKYLAMLLIPVVLIVGCATTGPRDAAATDLVGTWKSFLKGGTEADYSPFVAATLTYGEDASFAAELTHSGGYTEDLAGTYKVESSVVSYFLDDGSGEVPQFTAIIDGNELLLTDRFSDMWMRFRRE